MSKETKVKRWHYETTEIDAIADYLIARKNEYQNALDKLLEAKSIDPTAWAAKSAEYYERAIATVNHMMVRLAQKQTHKRRYISQEE